ncbi:MAG: type II toxin-antitoxin system ParD family antitoxin [Pseudomonadota bacterium]
MATMNISLPDQMKTWVEDQAKDGRYSNASDYVRALIRRDQEREAAVAAFQTAIDEGLASGPAHPFDPVAFRQRMQTRNGA